MVSHRYAQLVEPLSVHATRSKQTLALDVGTLIKNVRVENGGFAFDAWPPGEAFRGGVNWWQCTTDADLPAFTDRGREQRARRAVRIAKRGRPNQNRGHCMLTLRVRADQKEAVQRIAADAGTDVAGLLRRALLAKGMPL